MVFVGLLLSQVRCYLLFSSGFTVFFRIYCFLQVQMFSKNIVAVNFGFRFVPFRTVSCRFVSFRVVYWHKKSRMYSGFFCTGFFVAITINDPMHPRGVCVQISVVLPSSPFALRMKSSNQHCKNRTVFILAFRFVSFRVVSCRFVPFRVVYPKIKCSYFHKQLHLSGA